MISIEDFSKVEMKTGIVLAAEAIPKSSKLLKLQVDIGGETRQIVSGIAQFYKSSETGGKGCHCAHKPRAGKNLRCREQWHDPCSRGCSVAPDPGETGGTGDEDPVDSGDPRPLWSFIRRDKDT